MSDQKTPAPAKPKPFKKLGPVNWSGNTGKLTDAANSLSPAGNEVFPMRGYYLVIMADKTKHFVLPETKECKEHGSTCISVRAVGAYLGRGGTRAERLDPGHQIPEKCPICGSPVRYSSRLSTSTRTAWVCERSASEEEQIDTGLPKSLRVFGSRHYWQAQGKELSKHAYS